MWRFLLLLVAVAGLAFGSLNALAQNGKALRLEDIEGRYERTGVVDRAVEARFESLGLVLVPPVYIDELLTCPSRGTREDSEFVFRKQGTDYVALLPQAGVSCSLSELGSLAELEDGTLVLRRSVTLTGEGSSPIHADQEDRFFIERRDGAKWLVIETRLEWMKRSLFRIKKLEYRSLVRFRESDNQNEATSK